MRNHRRGLFLICFAGVLGLTHAASAECGKASRVKVAELSCGERISLQVNKVCATTTIRGKKTPMVAIEIEAVHPGTRGVAVSLYSKGSLGTSVSRLIRDKKAKAGKPFVIYDQSYNKEGAGGFKKAWAVTDKSNTKIDKVLLKIQLKKGGEVCKEEVSIASIWGTQWWDDGDSERDEF